MSETPQAKTPAPDAPGHSTDHHPSGTGPKIHRVCIGCNNMFEVTMENYEAKHCSVCHKG